MSSRLHPKSQNLLNDNRLQYKARPPTRLIDIFVSHHFFNSTRSIGRTVSSETREGNNINSNETQGASQARELELLTRTKGNRSGPPSTVTNDPAISFGRRMVTPVRYGRKGDVSS